VLSDLSALRYQYKYEYKKLYHHKPHELTDDFYIKAYFSFNDWKYIPKEKFEWIEEWHAHENRKYLIGVIHFKHLIENNWWRESGTSLILAPEPIIEDVEIRKLRKKSLELAGVV
jgi:homoserine dehydrogenase